MKLKLENCIVEIGDNSEDAIKILNGKDYGLVDGKLVVRDEDSVDENKINHLLNKVKKATTVDDIKQILKKIIKELI